MSQSAINSMCTRSSWITESACMVLYNMRRKGMILREAKKWSGFFKKTRSPKYNESLTTLRIRPPLQAILIPGNDASILLGLSGSELRGLRLKYQGLFCKENPLAGLF